jgi:hypothetical protein
MPLTPLPNCRHPGTRTRYVNTFDGDLRKDAQLDSRVALFVMLIQVVVVGGALAAAFIAGGAYYYR